MTDRTKEKCRTATTAPQGFAFIGEAKCGVAESIIVQIIAEDRSSAPDSPSPHPAQRNGRSTRPAVIKERKV
jgi:hypothetical protein